MKAKKVNRIIGSLAPLEEGEKTGIEIYVYASGHPAAPWAARIGGRSSLGETVHDAVDRALENLALDLRAEHRESR